MSTKEVKELKTQVGTLKNRINQLVDELKILKNEVGRFKTDVAADVKYLTERVDS